MEKSANGVGPTSWWDQLTTPLVSQLAECASAEAFVAAHQKAVGAWISTSSYSAARAAEEIEPIIERLGATASSVGRRRGMLRGLAGSATVGVLALLITLIVIKGGL
jgi:hypothetical protein